MATTFEEGRDSTGREIRDPASRTSRARETPGELRAALEKMEPDALVAFLVELAEQDESWRERVAELARCARPSRSAAALEERLDYFQRGRFTISYLERGAFVAELNAWLDDLETHLLGADPATAWTLVDRFLRTDRRILQGASDSNGAIRDTYRRACTLWHWAAATHPTESDWVDRIYALHADNEYGTRDAILDEAATSLSEPDLRRLARMYEREAEAATDGDSHRLLRASTAMGQVACALADARLHERSVRILSPEPNALQAEYIAEQYLRFGPVEEAIAWIHRAAEAEDRHIERLDLLAQAYEKLGDRERLIDTRRRLWERSLSLELFSEYTALLEEPDRDAARRRAVNYAEQSCDPVRAGLFLLDLDGPDRAAAAVLGHPDQLQLSFYGDLIELARGFEGAGRVLAQVVCYRALIEQVLEEGRTVGYEQAKRYLERLAELHPSVADYGSFPDHVAYEGHLRLRYAQERTFWQLFAGGEGGG